MFMRQLVDGEIGTAAARLSSVWNQFTGRMRLIPRCHPEQKKHL
jgi:hypothetical protein